MSVWLLPRMPLPAARDLLNQFPLSDQKALYEASLERREFGQVGAKVPDQVIESLADSLRQISREHGFPKEASRNEKSRFDRAVARRIAEVSAFDTGEALRDEFWTYFTLALLPDVAEWRFSGSKKIEERVVGGVRNVFQRLWIRAKSFDQGEGAENSRWELLELLSEDACVQIFERPTLGASPRLSSALAKIWVNYKKNEAALKIEGVFRNLVKRLLIENEFRAMDALDESRLLDELENLMRRSKEEIT